MQLDKSSLNVTEHELDPGGPSSLVDLGDPPSLVDLGNPPSSLVGHGDPPSFVDLGDPPSSLVDLGDPPFLANLGGSPSSCVNIGDLASSLVDLGDSSSSIVDKKKTLDLGDTHKKRAVRKIKKITRRGTPIHHHRRKTPKKREEHIPGKFVVSELCCSCATCVILHYMDPFHFYAFDYIFGKAKHTLFSCTLFNQSN